MSVERHFDFARIRNEFIRYYGAGGEDEYYVWLQALNLDENKPYAYSQKERFSFLKDTVMQRLREDKDNIYYRVLVGFPLRSMNDNLYTRDKLQTATGSLVDAFDCNLNHFQHLQLPGVRYVLARFEDGAVEAVVKIPKKLLCSINVKNHTYEVGYGKPLYTYVDDGTIVNQSLEADSRPDFHFTGSALLTKDVLPGIPLSRIFPLETVVSEALSASQMLKAKRPKLHIVGLGKEQKMPPNPPTTPNPPLNTQDTGDSVEADYPWDQCMADMQAQGHDADSAAAICAAIKNSTVSHAMLYGIAKTRREAIQLVAKRMTQDKLFTYLAGEVERLRSSTSNEAVSSLKVKVFEAEKKAKDMELQLEAKGKSISLEAEAKVKGFELALETAKADLLKESTARQKAEGRIIELETRNSKLEKASAEYIQDKIADGDTIKKFQRISEDKTEQLENLKSAHEKLSKQHTELDERYREALKTNLELSRKLTTTNEQYLTSEKRAEELEEKNKKMRRLGRIIVTTS